MGTCPPANLTFEGEIWQDLGDLVVGHLSADMRE